MGRAIARVTPWVLGLSLQLAAFAPGAVAVEYGRCHRKDTAPSGPPELQAAIVAYDRGDYSNAYQRFYNLATQGNAEAQYYTGCLHDGFHLGMRQDYAVALRWYQAAADQGHAEAQMRLGDLYAHGRGVPKDVREASRWYKAAESQRHVAAPRPTWDPSQIRREQADMQIRLDEAIAAYQRGDYPTAFAQFTDLASERGGQPRLKDAAHVQRLAQARYWLGLMYEKGQGTAQNLEEAARWYDAAYKSGNAEGAFNLAALYEQGRGVAPDYNKAHQLYSAAQARGHPQASAALQRLRALPAGGSIQPARPALPVGAWAAALRLRRGRGRLRPG